jgi:gamma-glutamyltranspeptidase/glutathione hydrolase
MIRGRARALIPYNLLMPSFDWSLPYPSNREGVLARTVVATSQPLAAQAGLRVMREGGNAIDGAIAAAITLTVVEPTSNGIGSDAFALVWSGGGLHGLNASGRAPAAMTPDRYAGMSVIPTSGWHGVTVPGAVSAWVELSRKFGRVPFERLFKAAIHYAREGFHVSRQTAYYWDRGYRTNRQFESWVATFAPKGRAPVAGELVTLPDHAATLELIAATNGEAFYRGELARDIAKHARETGSATGGGGLITEDDLAAHRADWVRPIALDFHGHRIHQIPPNGQGIIGLMALGMLRHHRLDEVEVDSVDSLHTQIEAMKLAFADGRRYVADIDSMSVVTPDTLLDPAYLESRARMIDKQRASDPAHGEPLRGGTVYLCTADAEGNMVSYIQSNYTGFGSGIVIPGRGIAMQNRSCCFTLEKGHPNEVGPGKRPYHTIIPGFVTVPASLPSPPGRGQGEGLLEPSPISGDGSGQGEGFAEKVPATFPEALTPNPSPPGRGESERPLLAFGVMGGYMQPQGHAQVLLRMLLHRQNPQAALDAPRWRIEAGRKVVIEPGFDDNIYEGLRARGHDLTIAPARTVEHGGGQAIWRLDDSPSRDDAEDRHARENGNPVPSASGGTSGNTSGGYFAASDQRRDGQAVGW